MAEQSSFFRNSGLLTQDLSPPPRTVRACLSQSQVIAQCLATCLVAGCGTGAALLFTPALPSPGRALAIAGILAGIAYIICRATRNDYVWVELDGETLRAKRLYTGRVVERSIAEIEDLLTLTFQVQTVETLITDAWLGRVRGFLIRFHDQRTPLQVSRADPAMRSAKELMEGIVYRMAEKREIDAEIVDLDGQPLVHRVHWKEPN